MKHQKQLLTYHNESWKKTKDRTVHKKPLKSWRKPKNKTSCVNQTKKTLLKYSNGNKLFKNLEND